MVANDLKGRAEEDYVVVDPDAARLVSKGCDTLVTRETLKRPFKRLNGQFGALKRLNVRIIEETLKSLKSIAYKYSSFKYITVQV
jgi:hypothetical protein